jgi:DNA-binding response OmpR family regulator
MKSKRILVVDADPKFFTYLQEETEKRGGKALLIEGADSFNRAVELIFSRRYDLVLVDFPGIRGPYLINLALLQGLPVAVLASSAMFPLEAYHLLERGVQEILPRECPEKVVSFLKGCFNGPNSSPGMEEKGHGP